MSFLRKNENQIIIIVTAILLAIGMIVEHFVQAEFYVFLSYYIVVFLICGHKPLFKAVTGIFHGEFLDENFLMSIASVGALAIGQYSEAVAVMLFYNIGEFFQKQALKKSRKSIQSAANIREEVAFKVEGSNVVKVKSSELQLGDIIEVKAGERIAVDGVVVSGDSSIDMSILTGESLPVDVKVNDNVLSGSLNLNGIIRVKVTKLESESTAAKIVELIENASISKSKSENFISKFAKVYTPIVVLIALLIAIVPPLIDGLWVDWVYRALSLLVISCPCAIVISVPLSFFGAIGSASKGGVLIKGGGYLEKLNQIDTFIFDKTGTLTKGNFEVSKINALTDESEFLTLLASVENYSNHPISKAITSKYWDYIKKDILTDVEEISGNGLMAIYNGSKVIVGKYEFLAQNGIELEKSTDVGSIVYLAKDNEYLGYVVVKDELKKGSKQFIDYLNSIGKTTIMLTGDNEQVANEVKEKLDISTAKCNLLPKDKLAIVNDLISSGKKVCYLGDGINDAPVLKRADVSIAMGKAGSDIAVDSADLVLLNDDLSKLIALLKLSKKTMRIIFENIFFPLFIKLLVLILTAVGISSMWLAIFADVGVMILAILNAIRLIKFKGK